MMKAKGNNLFISSMWALGFTNGILLIVNGTISFAYTVIILLILTQLIFISFVLFHAWKKRQNQMQRFELLEILPFPVMFIVNKRLVYINESGIDLLGPKSKIGAMVNTFINPDTMLKIERMTVKQTQEARVVADLLDVNDRQLEVEFTSSQSMNGYFLIIKDMTAIKENQKNLQHSERLSMIGELAAGIAHEIRNPLTSLKGFLQLLKVDEKDNGKYTNIMLSEIDRISLIVNELLLLAKPKELSFEPIKMLPMVRTVVTIAGTQAILYNISIHIQCEENDEDILLNCEENKLKQVLLNVLKNAIEAMSKEGSIIIIIVKGKDGVKLSIKDQGPGISPKHLAKLGERFYSTKQNGTGLGLMISRRIVEEHGGQLAVFSEIGKGTNVEITLPLYRS